MAEKNNNGPKRFVGILVALIILVLIYFLFYSGDKAAPEIEQKETGGAPQSQVELPNVNDATPKINEAPDLDKKNQ